MRVKRLSAFIAIFLIISTLFAFTACDGKSSTVQGVEFDRGSVALNIGETVTLNLFISPEGATGTVSWRSSDESVATVSDGKVTAIGEGTAKIRAKIGEYQAECTVTVTDPSKLPSIVTQVKLNAQRVELQLGAGKKNTYQLEATVYPETAKDKSLTWSSANDNIATVNDNGLVTAVSSGTVAVGCVSNNNISARVYVIVKNEDGTIDSDSSDELKNEEVYIGAIDSLENRTQKFIMAMDASEVLTIENARKANNEPLFKNFDGEEQDVFEIMADNGITDIRVRIWNDPKNDKGEWYGGGNCDINNAVEIAKRCKNAGLGIIVDFHYSDFWADPGKQTVPKDWASYNITQKESALYEFTKSSLKQIKDTGVKITMVQLGNETTGGDNGIMAGESEWKNVCTLLNAGSRAVREITGTLNNGGAKVAVHFTNAGNGGYSGYARTLSNNNVDYDVFGTSWYAYYESHGKLSGLTAQLKNVHANYGKEVMVLETAYAFTYDDADGLGTTQLETTTQPVTVQGMSNAVRDVIKAIADLGDWGLGVAYWGGTWIAASTKSNGEYNRQLCKQYGCGWASAAAREYDKDANDGGSMVDNNAFWLSDGTPLESLKVFKMVYGGQEKPLEADYIEDSEVYNTVDEGPIVLPKTVSVILNSGDSYENLPVVWNVTDEELAEYIHKVGMQDIVGTTEYGGTAHVYVWVMNANILDDASFENSKGYPQQSAGLIQSPSSGKWKIRHGESNTGKLQLYVSNEGQNARMGTQSFHFWDSGKIEFSLYQTFYKADLAEYGNGKYGASFDLQGGQATAMSIYAYITVTYSDNTTHTYEGKHINLTAWKEWYRTDVTGAEIGDNVVSIEVGIKVYAEPVGEGPWGNIDNCQFYFEG